MRLLWSKKIYIEASECWGFWAVEKNYFFTWVVITSFHYNHLLMWTYSFIYFSKFPVLKSFKTLTFVYLFVLILYGNIYMYIYIYLSLNLLLANVLWDNILLIFSQICSVFYRVHYSAFFFFLNSIMQTNHYVINTCCETKWCVWNLVSEYSVSMF